MINALQGGIRKKGAIIYFNFDTVCLKYQQTILIENLQLF